MDITGGLSNNGTMYSFKSLSPLAERGISLLLQTLPVTEITSVLCTSEAQYLELTFGRARAAFQLDLSDLQLSLLR